MKKCFMIDLDGTIYSGDSVLDNAHIFIQYLKQNKYPYVFFTNSPQRDKKELCDKLQKFDIECSCNDFLTTVDVIIDYLNQKKDINNIYVLGSKSMKKQIIDAGYQLVEHKNTQVDYVIIGYDPMITLEECNQACIYIQKGAKTLLCNIDTTIPTAKGIIPHTGAIDKLINSATNSESKSFGKPSKYTYDFILKYFHCSNDELIIVGDNLETDILLGKKFELHSYLLLTGLTRKEYIKKEDYFEKLRVCNNLQEVMQDLG